MNFERERCGVISPQTKTGTKKTSPMHLGFEDVSVSIVGFIKSKGATNPSCGETNLDEVRICRVIGCEGG